MRLGALAAALAVLAATGCAHAPGLAAGGHYVAMGSSFAAGPGVTQSAETPPTRCFRSRDNYAQQLARKRGLNLTDVSCSGATTAHVLGPWNELPAQVDAVRPDTRLVTVTIGGNDVSYVRNLMAASCAEASRACPSRDWPTDEAYRRMEAGLRQIAAEVRRRAPRSQLVFVDYLSILPSQGVCARTPVSDADADAIREIERRLAAATARVAKAEGAQLVRASELSRAHDACSVSPWMAGYARPGDAPIAAPYHPNLAGMTAVAEALDRALRR